MKIKAFLISFFMSLFTYSAYGVIDHTNAITVYFHTHTENPWIENASADARYPFNTAVLGLLVQMDADFNIKPVTLEAFYWDYRNKHYILKLKPNLYFNNGRKVTIKDLEFSILRPFFAAKNNDGTIRLLNLKGAEKIVHGQEYKSGLVEGVKILDENTLAVTPSSPNPSFMYSLTRSNFSLVPMEEFEKDLLHWKKWPIGVGPYKIVNEDKLKKNYLLELVDPKAYPDAPQKIKFELARNEKPDLAFKDPTLINDATMKKTELLAPYYIRYFSINFASKLGRNPDFRKALSLALQREAITSKTILPTKPLNEIITKGAIGRLNVKENYNLAEAQKLFAKILGKHKDKIIKIPHSSDSHSIGSDYRDVIIKQLREAGFNIEFIQSDELWDTFQGEFKDSPFHLVSKAADFFDPLLTFGIFKKGSPSINSYPNDEKLFQLIENAQDSPNRDVLTQNILKLSQYFYENNTIIPLFVLPSIAYYNPQKIKSVGDQFGGQTFHLVNIVMQKDTEEKM